MLRACLIAGLIALQGGAGLSQTPSSQISELPPPTLRERAEAGDIEAAFNYGYDLTFPDSGEPDTVTGRFWLARAADGGHAPANAVLGLIYRDGYGVTADSDRARAFLELAWQAGDTLAGHDLAELILYDFPSERTTAITLLEALLDDVETGPLASLTLAETLMFEGDGEADAARAVMLAREALGREPGLARAYYLVGIGAAEGLAGEVDQAAAREAWETGSEAGDSLALIALAESWLDPDWGEPDRVEAFVLFTLAADLGDSDAADAADTLWNEMAETDQTLAATKRSEWEGRMGWAPIPG